MNWPSHQYLSWYSHRTVSLHQIDELGNDFLGVLARPIHIVWSCHDDGKMIGILICLHNELSSGLWSGIGIGGVEKCFFHHVLLFITYPILINFTFLLLSVHLIRAHMNETLDVVYSACLQQNMRPNHIVVGEGHAVSKRIIYLFNPFCLTYRHDSALRSEVSCRSFQTSTHTKRSKNWECYPTCDKTQAKNTSMNL